MSCEICFEDNCKLTCGNCNKSYCKDCITKYIETSKNLTPLCPECSTNFNESDIINLFEEEFKSGKNPLDNGSYYNRVMGFNNETLLSIIDSMINGESSYRFPKILESLLKDTYSTMFSDIARKFNRSVFGASLSKSVNIKTNQIFIVHRTEGTMVSLNSAHSFYNSLPEIEKNKIYDFNNHILKLNSQNLINRVNELLSRHPLKRLPEKTNQEIEEYIKTDSYDDIAGLNTNNIRSIAVDVNLAVETYLVVLQKLVDSTRNDDLLSNIIATTSEIASLFKKYLFDAYAYKTVKRISTDCLCNETKLKNYIKSKLNCTVSKANNQKKLVHAISIFRCTICNSGYYDINGDRTCILCNTLHCKDCNVPIKRGDDHQCKDSDKETLKSLLNESKPCPNCKTRIFKITGCDDMFCTYCKSGFSWRTGKIITRSFHNEHRQAWLENKTKSFGIDKFRPTENNLVANSFNEIMDRYKEYDGRSNYIKIARIELMTKELKSYIDRLKKDLDNMNTTDVHGYTVNEYYYRICNELFKLRSSGYDFEDDEFTEAISKAITLSDFELKKLLAQKSKDQYINEYIRKEKSKLYELGTTVYSAILQHLVEGILSLQRNSTNIENLFVSTSDNILKLVDNFQQTLNNSYKDILHKLKVLNIEPDFEIPPNFWLLGDDEGTKLLSPFVSSWCKQNPKAKYKILFEDKIEFLEFLASVLKSVHRVRADRNSGYEFIIFNSKVLDTRAIETELRQLKLTKYITILKIMTDEIVNLFPDVCCDKVLPCYIENKDKLFGLNRFANLGSFKIKLCNYIQNYYQKMAPKPKSSSLLHRIMEQHTDRSFDSDEFVEYTY